MSALFFCQRMADHNDMNFIFTLALIILTSCSRVSPRKNAPDDTVSLDAALNQARSSYLKGCVDTFHELKIPKVFTHCMEKAKAHEQELIGIMNQEP